MDVPTLTMPADLAQEKYEEYKAALATREATEEDSTIMLGYKALAAGKQLLDLHQVFRACPVDDKGRPRLAVARADWQFCHHRGGSWRNPNRAVFARSSDYLNRRGNTGNVAIPRAMMPQKWNGESEWRALVPIIPAPIRPAGDLSRFHVLFEAEWQPVAPKDPLLLSRMSGSLYVILAAWDLTELERAVLAGRFLQPTA